MSKNGGAVDSNQMSSSEAESLLQELQKRAKDLLDDLKAFQSSLRDNGILHEVEVGFFRKGVESEVKSLQSISKLYVNQDIVHSEDDAEPRQGRFLHALRSSNLPFYEAVWYTARQRRGVIALGKRISLVSGKFRSKQNREIRGKQEKYGVVDIVADDGLEWIKVSTITEKRLLFDIAKEGWATYGAGSDSDEDGYETGSEADIELEIVQLARHLQNASRNHRVQYRHPKVIFVLPKIREGVNSQIDAVLADIRATNATVICASLASHIDGITTSFDDLRLTPNPDYQSLVPNLSVPDLTSRVNIDCTILLALISDISHVSRQTLPPSPANSSATYHKAILKQIDIEERRPLLPKEIYLVLQDKELVCTNYAATRMREIVETMGTETERIRSLLFFGREDYSQYTADQLRDTLRSNSSHTVPDDLHLPIKIVDFDGNASQISAYRKPTVHLTENGASVPDRVKLQAHQNVSSKDIEVALKIISPIDTHMNGDEDKPVRSVLSPINTSVFLFGWMTQIVTITSNKAVAMHLKKKINEVLDAAERERDQKIRNNDTDRTNHLETGKIVTNTAAAFDDQDEFIGPQIYICDTARSLVGKEKQGGE